MTTQNNIFYSIFSLFSKLCSLSLLCLSIFASLFLSSLSLSLSLLFAGLLVEIGVVAAGDHLR